MSDTLDPLVLDLVEWVAKAPRPYAEVIDAPVMLGTAVERLERRSRGPAGFQLTTSRGTLDADRVVVAVGGFHVPRIPAAGESLSGRVTQLHSHSYRNQAALANNAGNKAKAEAAFAKVVELAPNDPEALISLAPE